MQRLLVVLFAASLACSRPTTTTPPPDAAASEPAVDAAEPSPVQSTAATPIPPSSRIVREEADVRVRGVIEHWRLEWRKPPTPTCMDDSWYTCPCNGIEFGEEGELDLVREREGEPLDRLALDALYMGLTAQLPRWQKSPTDDKQLEPPGPAVLRQRPLVKILKLGDYDHDGQATELVLRVGYEACGHSPAIVVGVDARNPKLHAFTAVDTPKEPLALENVGEWEKVKKTLPLTLTAIGCGDHGSQIERKVRLERDDLGLHVKASERPCP